MKNNQLICTLLLAAAFMQSCQVAEGIFKAGMWWAFIVIAIVGVGLYLLFRKR